MGEGQGRDFQVCIESKNLNQEGGDFSGYERDNGTIQMK